MPVLPFSRHIGPGNDILEAGSNEIDNIAREHDLTYENAWRMKKQVKRVK